MDKYTIMTHGLYLVFLVVEFSNTMVPICLTFDLLDPFFVPVKSSQYHNHFARWPLSCCSLSTKPGVQHRFHKPNPSRSPYHFPSHEKHPTEHAALG
jgi:hypothetical protein